MSQPSSSQSQPQAQAQPHSRPRRNGRHSHSPNRSRHQNRSRSGGPRSAQDRDRDRDHGETSSRSRGGRDDHRDWVPVDRGRDIRRREAAKGPSLLRRILSVLSFGMLGAKKAPAARIPSAARRSVKPERSGQSGSPLQSDSQQSSSRRSTGRSPESRRREQEGDSVDSPQSGSESRSPKTSRAERPLTPPNPEAVTGPRLHVGNLSYDAAESDLMELFQSAGTVESVEVAHHRDTHRSKGFAFVLMDSIEAAQSAVASLHGQDFMGRRLEIGPARSLGGRSASRDSSRSGSEHAEDRA